MYIVVFAVVELNDYVAFQNVEIIYDGASVLKDINTSFPEGKTTMIVGSSGSGKTSLLNCINGKIKPNHGRVFVNSVDITQIENKREYRKNIGMLFQKSGLFPDLTVSENVALPYYEHYPNLKEDEINTLVKLKLQAVGLRGVYNKLPRELSGGMERRVALARAVALDPPLILYDEPLTGQDPISCGVLISLMSALKNAYGATSIIVSHQIKHLANHVDRICVVGNNGIIINDDVDKVFACKEPYVQQFLAGVPDGVVTFHYPAVDINDDLGLGELNA